MFSGFAQGLAVFSRVAQGLAVFARFAQGLAQLSGQILPIMT
jgi:hypothetical protein